MVVAVFEAGPYIAAETGCGVTPSAVIFPHTRPLCCLASTGSVFIRWLPFLAFSALRISIVALSGPLSAVLPVPCGRRCRGVL